MKKKFSLLLAFFIVLSCSHMTAFAKNGKDANVIGYIYSTDILAYIDDKPIPSYNIGGETVVSEKDLSKFGFRVSWNEKKRILDIHSYMEPENPPFSNITRGKVGKVLGNVYKTDVLTYVNNFKLPSYNIGGETMISLEKLSEDIHEPGFGSFTPNDNCGTGHSNMGFQAVWDEKNRTINLHTMQINNFFKTQYGTFRIVNSCFQYIDPFLYNPIAQTVSIHPQNDFTLPDKTCQDKDYTNYFDVNETLKYYNEKYEWKSNALIIYEPVGKKSYDLTQSRPYRTDYTCSLLPVVKVPVIIHLNGKDITFKTDMIIYQGLMCMSLKDLKPYLFS